MSDQEINIAIAEVVGWKDLEINYHSQLIGRFPEYGTIRYVPNYFGDLNAMHEAEGTLTKQQQEEYDYQLSEITAPITGERWSLLHANARQRAEAFIKTLNLENNTNK